MTNQAVQLISPTPDLGETYRSLISEFKDRQEPLVPWVLGLEAESFGAPVTKLQAFSQGIGVPPGFVANSTFWLVDSYLSILGVSNLRHSLTDRLRHQGGHIGFGIRPSARGKGLATLLLARTLQEARKIGIDRALLTCDIANVASARVILKNGGVLDSEEEEADGNVVQRYWIALSE